MKCLRSPDLQAALFITILMLAIALVVKVFDKSRCDCKPCACQECQCGKLDPEGSNAPAR